MTFKEFLIKIKEAFYNAMINCASSTTFWMTIVCLMLYLFKVLPWETVLITAGIFGVNRATHVYTEGK